MIYLLYYVYEGVVFLFCVGVFYVIIFFYGLFWVGDGKIVIFGLQNECEWEVFCCVVFEQLVLVIDECFLVNLLRVKNCEVLMVFIYEVFVFLMVEVVVEWFEWVQIVNVCMNDMQDVWNYFQFKVCGWWMSVLFFVGEILVLYLFGMFDVFVLCMDGVLVFGQYSWIILVELGYDKIEID